MVVSDVASEVEFLRTVFDATGEVHTDRPAEIRIGDSLVMVTPAGERELFPAFLYVYVDDADAAYRRHSMRERGVSRSRSILLTAIGGRWYATRSETSFRSHIASRTVPSSTRSRSDPWL
jgi:hypothetical protein